MKAGVHSLLLHEYEGIIVQIAVVVHIRLNAPIVLEVCQQRVMVEKTAEIATHVVIRLPAVRHSPTVPSDYVS